MINKKVAFVGTFPPQECGIATFTSDLVTTTEAAGWKTCVVAIEDQSLGTHAENSNVIFTIEKEKESDYRYAISVMENNNVGILSIQHEYGIFGGDHGDYVLQLAKFATMPVVVTLHTVLPFPSDRQKYVVKKLEKYVSKFVVMAEKAIEILRDSYGVNPEKVQVIPHGVPDIPFEDVNDTKSKFNLSGKIVLSTFGLISPTKGIEDVITSLKNVVSEHPNVKYLVLGETHPVVKRKEGETYREGLNKQVEDLGLQDNVEFINHYLTIQDLTEYLQATDIYITPYYANPYQITSGTLAYAMGAGKAIVSTPYLYAEELMSNQRGFLYPFRNTEILSSLINNLISNETLFNTTRKKAYKYGRTMTWETVGLQYARLFTQQALVSKKSKY